MSEMVNNLDITIRLYLTILELDGDAQKMCEDALEEIERLRKENRRLKNERK